MTIALGCIADDYTGASDLANTLTKAGLRTVQTIGVPDELALPDVDAVVVALKSRSIEAEKAVTLSRAADRWLRAQGAGHVLFKICSTFDSTDAGNIGPVTDALRADADDPIVLVTPAFPETGRTVYQGNLFVGAVPLNESPLKDHPLNPMHDANLVRVLARQSRNKIGLVDLFDGVAGRRGHPRAAEGARGSGIRAAIVDAVFDRDLESIGRAALDHRALGRRLRHRARAGARAHCRAAGCAPRRMPPRSARRSAARPHALREAARRRRSRRLLRRKPRCRCCGSIPTRSSRTERGREALGWAAERLDRGPILIASSATPDEVAAVQSRHGRDAAGHAIEQAFASLAVRPCRSAACAASSSRAARPPARWWTGSAFRRFRSGRKSPPAFRCCARSA